MVYVLLGVAFFLIVTPQALLNRCVNKKKKREKLTHRTHRYNIEDLRKMW